MPDSSLFTIRLALPGDTPDTKVAEIALELESGAISTSWEKNKKGWEILWLFSGNPDAKTVAGTLSVKPEDLEIAPVPETNWLEESYRAFPPFQVGPFFIYGSHYDGKVPKGLKGLQIDAATAFGSGEHGTTAGCLEALARLQADGMKPKRILDMGTGSGILAIAAAKLWKKPILAIDNDPESVKVACRHRRLNGLSAGDFGISCSCGDGYKAAKVQKAGAVFDLIIANILAGPLIAMAPELEKSLAPNGLVILSGLLKEQEANVLAAHKAVGLKKLFRIPKGEWCTLVLSRKTGSSK
jgi:ribosomal protein L11 methyltransferase